MIVHESAITHIRSTKPDSASGLRVEIKAGGCSGFEKQFTWAYDLDPDDITYADLVMCDPTTDQICTNAVLKYVKDISGSRFHLEIPEATTNCGCGVSFNF